MWEFIWGVWTTYLGALEAYGRHFLDSQIQATFGWESFGSGAIAFPFLDSVWSEFLDDRSYVSNDGLSPLVWPFSFITTFMYEGVRTPYETP